MTSGSAARTNPRRNRGRESIRGLPTTSASSLHRSKLGLKLQQQPTVGEAPTMAHPAPACVSSLLEAQALGMQQLFGPGLGNEYLQTRFVCVGVDNFQWTFTTQDVDAKQGVLQVVQFRQASVYRCSDIIAT
ncbi:hypothetical protein BS643_22660 [Pseudomonas protegens]|nr:hypothetical protein BBH58_28385 [Pseudomonas protegens]OBZ21282.1 hypothetical protein BBH57_28420 [Pseudomonas protegens]OKK40550.1 hypothetical protein BS643_22660 [Pseudomonas protegens]OKK59622.1 hypothetical protein BS645_17150 [Pseudomonas protegens]